MAKLSARVRPAKNRPARALVVILLALLCAGCAAGRREPVPAPVRTGRGIHAGDIVHLVTPRGTVDIMLHENQAPQNCANFVDLTEYGFYDGSRFYEIVPEELVKTGCPRGDGLGGPGYFIPDEIVPGLAFDRPGVVAMASDGPNTNGSQFFITLKPRPDLNGKYTIIGHVSNGFPALSRLQPGDRIERAWVQGRY